jgi:uncharacterized membrane protein YeaQ/YmgE (transglycosylase-associated protein family)
MDGYISFAPFAHEARATGARERELRAGGAISRPLVRRPNPTLASGGPPRRRGAFGDGCRVGASLIFVSCDRGTGAIHFNINEGPTGRGNDMNFIIWLVVGGIIGWLASMVMKTDAQQGVILNVVVGIIGAMLGGWLISPLVGVGTINQDNFSLPAMLVSLVGAIILLGIVNLFRRGRAR